MHSSSFHLQPLPKFISFYSQTFSSVEEKTTDYKARGRGGRGLQVLGDKSFDSFFTSVLVITFIFRRRRSSTLPRSPHPCSSHTRPAAHLAWNCLWCYATLGRVRERTETWKERHKDRSAVPAGSHTHTQMHKHTVMSTYMLHYRLHVHSQPRTHIQNHSSPTCILTEACMACIHTLLHLHTQWGGGCSCGPDGPSHAADRPTLLDQRQPGSAHTTLLQT